MIKYTHKENQSMMAPLTLQAHELGLLDGDAKLVYGKGNGSYGISTEIYVEKTVDGQRKRLPRPQWLPEIGYKDGPSVVGNALVNVSNVLYSMMQLRNKAAEPKDASRNSYRRGELENVDATGEYPAKIKIYSDAGDTKHLNITATEFEQIKNVLLDYRND